MTSILPASYTNPLLVVVFSTIFLQARYKPYQWIGVLLGLVGVVITLGGRIDFKIGILFGILPAVFWASATILVKNGVNLSIRGFYPLIRCFLVDYYFYLLALLLKSHTSF
jgi:drug/metabolite transporter (DMT)-like permease